MADKKNIGIIAGVVGAVLGVLGVILYKLCPWIKDKCCPGSECCKPKKK